MSVFGINTTVSGLGKPTIKLEFESNSDLLDFQKKMQEGGVYDSENAFENENKNYEDADFEDVTNRKELNGMQEVLSYQDFYKIITYNPEKNLDYLQRPQNFDDLFKNKTTLENGKKYYIIDTPIKQVKRVFLSSNRLRKHITYSNKHKNKNAWAYIIPTLERPNFIYKYNDSFVFLKPFLLPDGTPVLIYLLPVALQTTTEHFKDEILSFYKKESKKGKYYNLYNQYLKGGGETVYSIKMNTKSTNSLNGAVNEVAPFIADFRLICDKIDNNFADNKIIDEKNLGAAGDLYLVRDLRTRARKEPGDVSANKNLIFEKQDDKTIKNFNKDFYLQLQQNKDSLENDSLENYPETILFNNKIYEKKNIGYDSGDSGQIFFEVFFPKIKPAKDIFKGYTEREEVNVPLKECINLIPRSKYYFITYISHDFLKKIFVDFIKKNYNKLLKSRERYLAGGYNTSEIDKEIKYYSLYYSNPQAYSAQSMYGRGAIGRAAYEAKKYIDGENFSLGKTANPLLYNNLEILECRGMKPTYTILKNYDSFFDSAKNQDSLTGFGLNDTKKLIKETCLKHYPECAKIAAHLKADSKLQSCFNLWHWLEHNIRYEYDRDGREEIRTPLRTWADRFRGVDCDCLSVFSWCVLRCMGYNPAFELAAFKNKNSFSHIYLNLDGIIVDRVWFVFNSRPPNVTKTEQFFIIKNNNLGNLF